jgi:fibronectin-binding autotransporter adhesin
MMYHFKKQATSFTYPLVRAAALALALAMAPAAHAVLYWDADSMLGGNGNWDTTSTNWRTTNDVGAPNSTWTPDDGTQDAAFNGSAGYTVTIPSGTISANSLTFGVAAGNVRITGGTINISDPDNSIVMNTNNGAFRTQIIQSAISGTDITMVPNPTGTGRAFLTLGSNPTGPANTFTGDLIFGGASNLGLSQIAIDHPDALPATATVRMKRGNSQLLFGGGGAGQTAPYTATFNNDIILNDGVSGTLTQSIGAFVGPPTPTVATLGGIISGDANLIFELGAGGGNGTIVLANQATYTGNTTLNSQTNFILRLAVDDAIPVSTRFSVNRGRFDMAGFDQKIGGLTSTGANGFVTNTSGTISTLTIDGNETGNFQGVIGTSTISGSNDNVALLLASTNTGTLTLSNSTTFGNTYSGGTTINGGRLLAGNDLGVAPFSSATGSGAVAVNSGGTLGGTGGVSGAVTVASGGRIAPGLAATANTIGTFSALSTLALNSGSSLDIGLGAPAPGGGTSDRVDMPGIFGSGLTVPAGPGSITVNLSDPAGGAAGNGTYILMSFPAGTYTGSTNASQFVTGSSPNPDSLNGATISYHLADNTNTIQEGGNAGAATRVIMNVTGGPNALLWTGGAGNGNWDVGTTANFNNLGTNSATTFAGNDNVTFTDSGLNTNPVTVAGGGVQPNIMTVNNTTATTYTFSGGPINGSSVGGGGALFLSGNGAATFNSHYTAAGPITSSKTGAVFNGNITNATSLTVNGGSVTLAGANTYPGDTTVNGGTLTAQGMNATFGIGDVTVSAGSAIISAGVDDAIFDSATLTLAGGGASPTMADSGFINLGASINEIVGSLVLGATTFTSGTFGATGSGAQNIMDEYFAGTGILTVGTGPAGDYNKDGIVDVADFVMWAKDDGSPGGYTTWAADFGEGNAGAGGLADPSRPAVPEPASALLLFMATAAVLMRRRGCA